jgi:DNA topoisomerase-2
VGSNNINLLKPSGQFGTRVLGGKDCASARYIHTELANVTLKIFRPEDAPVLEYNEDDGTKIEPTYYVPIIPMALANGLSGIATGFSTCIPCFDPIDILDNARRFALSEDIQPMSPKYRGFKGTITEVPDDQGVVKKWKSSGTLRRTSEKTIEITELPIGTWTEDYKTFLETEVSKSEVLKGVDSHYTEADVRFVLRATAQDAEAAMTSDALKLTTEPKNLRMTNVHLFNAASVVTKFEDIETIVREHGKVRLETYDKRKAFQERELEALLIRLNAKARFVMEVIDGTIVLLGKKKADLEAQLIEREFPDLNGMDYLIGMPIGSLTSEKRDALVVDAENKTEELEVLKGTTSVAIWMRELDELRTELLKDVK